MVSKASCALGAAATVGLLLVATPNPSSALDADRFNRLSDRDIERIAEEWDKDEEEDPDDPMVKRKRAMESGGGIDPSAAAALLQKGGDAIWETKRGQTVMIFLTFNPDIDTKEEANEVAGRMVGMLSNGHIELKPYPIEDNKFIFIVDDGSKVPEVLKVLKAFKEFNFAEIEQQKYFGDHSHLKLNPTELKKEEERLKKRDDHIRDRQKWPKVVEKRGKGKKKADKKKKSKKNKKKSTTKVEQKASKDEL